MSEESQLPVVFNDAQRDIILMQTPPEEIRWREGRGGKMLAYVEIGYVNETLNLATGFDWDFEVVYHEYLEALDEILVLGKLTVRGNGRSITKSQFGGAQVNRSKKTNEIICLTDDYKAAASDALKKCASLLGVAHDVYRGRVKATTGKATETKAARKSAQRVPKTAEGTKATRHWIDGPKARAAFWAWTKGTLELTEAQVYEGLRVSKMHDYTGTMKDAKAALEAYAFAKSEANQAQE